MHLISRSKAALTLARLGGCAGLSGLAAMILVSVDTVARAQPAAEPIYAVTYLDVSADWLVQGVGLLKQYREQSAHQAGNLEFTVMQETARPNRFVIVEGWRDDAAFAAHAKSTDTALFEFTLEAIRNSPPNQHVLRGFATTAARPAGAGAIHMVEHIDFQPGANAEALPRVRALAQASQKEDGVARYDIYQEPAPHANHYSVVAVWTSRSAYDAHEAARHTREFRAAAPRANLYDQRIYNALD